MLLAVIFSIFVSDVAIGIKEINRVIPENDESLFVYCYQLVLLPEDVNSTR